METHLKFRFIGIQVLNNEVVKPEEKDITETGFSTPEDLGEGVFGWGIAISSTLNNPARTQALFIETSSEFQFSANAEFGDEFNKGSYLEVIFELVYAAHCQHNAIFHVCASEHLGFEGVQPRFCSFQEVKEFTEEALRNAKSY